MFKFQKLNSFKKIRKSSSRDTSRFSIISKHEPERELSTNKHTLIIKKGTESDSKKAQIEYPNWNFKGENQLEKSIYKNDRTNIMK